MPGRHWCHRQIEPLHPYLTANRAKRAGQLPALPLQRRNLEKTRLFQANSEFYSESHQSLTVSPT